MLLEGMFAPVTTPFHSDGRLYLRKLEDNIRHYSRTPLAGMVVLGSTGEAVMLSDEESREVLATAAVAAAPHKVLLAGVGRESVAGTVELAEYAARLHYDAVLIRTPHFYRPQLHRAENAAAMLTYYRTVADRSPLPVVLYSVPAYTKYDLPVELIVELAQHPNIIGMKDSSGNVERIAQIVSLTQAVKRTVTVTPVFAAVTGRMLAESGTAERASGMVTADALSAGGAALAVAPSTPALKTRTKEVDFQVLAGMAQGMLPCLRAGAVGTVLAFSSCAPQACYEVFAAWKDGDEKLAEEKQQRIAPAAERIGSQMGVPGIKYAADLNGYYGGNPRLPLLPLTASERAEVEQWMADMRH
ncbi:MAG: dihydrodipicolinate synthase family protein [Acidobacteriaceae bacterium]